MSYHPLMVTPVRSYWVDSEYGPFHMHITAPIDDLAPERAFGIYFVMKEINAPVRSAEVQANWGLSYGYQDKITDQRGFAVFNMPTFYGPMARETKACPTFRVHGKEIGYFVVAIGESITVPVPRGAWGKGKLQIRTPLPQDSWRHVRHPCD